MCGRYVVPNTTDELLSLFDASNSNAADWTPSYSVAPTDSAPIVREWIHDETAQRDVDLASWGLKPSWAKPGGPAPINARLESVASNGMFLGAFASERCLKVGTVLEPVVSLHFDHPVKSEDGLL